MEGRSPLCECGRGGSFHFPSSAQNNNQAYVVQESTSVRPMLFNQQHMQMSLRRVEYSLEKL